MDTSLCEPFPRIDIPVFVVSWIRFKVEPLGPRIFPEKLTPGNSSMGIFRWHSILGLRFAKILIKSGSLSFCASGF